MHVHPNHLEGVTCKNTVVIVIDAQTVFVGMAPDGIEATKKMRECCIAWNGALLFTKHLAKLGGMGSVQHHIPNIDKIMSPWRNPGVNLARQLLAFENEGWVCSKEADFSAAFESRLLPWLRARSEVSNVVIMGLTTPVCVFGTVRDLARERFKVMLVHDACASQPMEFEAAGQSWALSHEEAHRAAVTFLGFVSCQVISTPEFIAHLESL